jgi:hypothetical protein
MKTGNYVRLVNVKTKRLQMYPVCGPIEKAQVVKQQILDKLKSQKTEDGRPLYIADIKGTFRQQEDSDFLHVDAFFKGEEDIDDLRQKVYSQVEGVDLIWRWYVDAEGNDVPETREYTLNILPYYAESALQTLKTLDFLMLRPSQTLPTVTEEQLAPSIKEVQVATPIHPVAGLAFRVA